MRSLLMRCSTVRVALLSLFAAASCATPSPLAVTSPDEELASLLRELENARDGELARGGEPRSTARAATEGAVAAELRRLALAHPYHVPTLVALAATAYERRDLVQAQTMLDQALSHEPTHLQAVLLRARIAAELGNLPYARRKLKELLEISPDEPELHEAYAGVLYLAGDFEDAKVELDLAEHLEAEALWRIEYHRGLIAEAEGREEDALESYRRCLDENPDFEPAARRDRWLRGHAAAAESD